MLCFVLLLGGLFANPFLKADPVTDALFVKLQDESMDVRIEALRELQLTLDPRLPEALLLLLADEGNSIRRLAARGIGSRYWQVPEERVPAFVEALKVNSKSEFHGEGEMAYRALALLTKTYDGPEMSRSANGRWVLYERYSLPCLIDTQSGTEELLGWGTEDHARFYYHGRENKNAEFTCWHPEKEIAVLEVSLSRRVSSMWAWIHYGGVKKLDHERVLTALGFKPEQLLGSGGFSCDHAGWSGNAAVVNCSFMVSSYPKGSGRIEDIQIGDVEGTLLWDITADKLVKAP